MPCTNTSGRNTAIVVRVDAVTAMPTSDAPATAACTTPMPASRLRAMFSSTTIESSTTMPVASARPPSDITFKDSPKRSMKKNVVISETGNDSETISVLRAWPRKKKITRIASTPPISASLRTSESASRMNTDWSSSTVSVAPEGRLSPSLSSSSRTARATLTVLASPCL